jgi:hypothetical protein
MTKRAYATARDIVFSRAHRQQCEILRAKGSAAIPTEPVVLRTIRTCLLGIIVLVMFGTAADLLLLKHYESGWQLAPLVLIGAGVCTAAACAYRGTPAALVAWRLLMVLFMAAGVLGILLHYSGNVEFQKEVDPSLSGWPLLVKVLTAKAPPALAPAVMVQVGLLGLLYTYRHPALSRAAFPDQGNASGANA